MAGRGGLPLFAADAIDVQHDLRDLLLGRAGTMAVDRLQHAALPLPLLAGQPRVGWNAAPMQAGEEPQDGLDPVEPIEAERHERYEMVSPIVRRAEERERLHTAEIDGECCALIVMSLNPCRDRHGRCKVA